MIIRRADLEDVNEIMGVIKEAQALLKSEGVDQWQDGFPNHEVIKSDILNCYSYVFIENTNIVGFVVIAAGEDEGYKTIYDGEWINKNGSYITIHRTAFSNTARGLGLSKLMFDLAESIAQEHMVESIRIDTHDDNKRMKHIIMKNNYTHCGYIKLAISGAKRVVFEKVLI